MRPIPLPTAYPEIKIQLGESPLITWTVTTADLAELIDEELPAEGGPRLLQPVEAALRSGDFSAVSDSEVTLPFNGPRQSPVNVTLPFRDLVRRAHQAAAEIPGALDALVKAVRFYQDAEANEHQ